MAHDLSHVRRQSEVCHVSSHHNGSRDGVVDVSNGAGLCIAEGDRGTQTIVHQTESNMDTLQFTDDTVDIVLTK